METGQAVSETIKRMIQGPKPDQALIQALVDASDRCLLAVDSKGVIFLTNALAREKLQIRPGDRLKEALPQLDEPVDKTLISSRPQTDLRIRIDAVEFAASAHPLLSGNDSIGAVCRLNDTTGLENVVKKMQFFQSMSRELDAIINSSSDGLFVCDGQANVIRMNPASERIHNATQKELAGRNMSDLIDEGFIDSSAALEACRTRETATLLQNKGDRKLISTGTPVFDDQGDLIRVVVSERDITQIDQLQRELEEQASIKNHLEHQLLQAQVKELKTQTVIARSRPMLAVDERAYRVSGVDSSVLITGESGSGKGVIVNLIHNNSPRADKPLVRINCGAIPEPLIESELFGYEPGAFTGALAGGKPGSLEMADDGSLFLDEIAELPLTAQVKLLRFLENGRVTRLGGSRSFTVNARILAATHRDLKKMVADGTFRHDLYYRLNVIPIAIPPLRERPDCIPPLLRHYVDYFSGAAGARKRLGRAALDNLLAYAYPGNVRELMNICERIVVMSETNIIDPSDLPGDVVRSVSDRSITIPVEERDKTLSQILALVEQQVLERALKKYPSQTRISRALGVSQPTIARRLKKYGLTSPD